MSLGILTPCADRFRTGSLSNETAPQRSLWAAVLAQALADAIQGVKMTGRPVSEHPAIVQKARDYFDEPNPYLDDICTLLGLDPDAVRYHVKRQIKAAPTPDDLAAAPLRRNYLGCSTKKAKRKRKAPGVVLDLSGSQGTGGGTVEQDSTEIEFSGRKP